MTSEEISNKFGWKKSTVESCMIGRARKETMEALYEALSDSLPVAIQTQPQQQLTTT
jgi:hypothetical protein